MEIFLRPGCTSIQWANGDMGLSGQGEIENPLSIHVNHVTTRFNNIFYDASYGYKEDANYVEYENDNIAAPHVRLVYANEIGTPNIRYFLWIGAENDDTKQDLIVTEN